MFDAEEDAARAFDKAAVRGHGREAELNFPEEAGSHHRRRRGLAAYDSDPEISAESEGGDGPQVQHFPRRLHGHPHGLPWLGASGLIGSCKTSWLTECAPSVCCSGRRR